MSRVKSELPFNNYDIRLIRICQCPQILYLDKNLFPTKEAVEAVLNGTLYVEKDANGIQLLHVTKKNIVIGSELSELLKNHEYHKYHLMQQTAKSKKRLTRLSMQIRLSAEYVNSQKTGAHMCGLKAKMPNP